MSSIIARKTSATTTMIICAKLKSTIRSCSSSSPSEDDAIDQFIANSRELNGMPDLAEKRWNAKSLAETAEQARKLQQENSQVEMNKEIDRQHQQSISSCLDFEGKPLHRDLAKSLRMNVFKKMQKQNISSPSSTSMYSGKKWFTKSQISQLGYHVKPSSEPIFAPHYGKILNLINLDLFFFFNPPQHQQPQKPEVDFSSLKSRFEEDLIYPILGEDKYNVDCKMNGKPYWLTFGSSSGKNKNNNNNNCFAPSKSNLVWQTSNTKIILEELTTAQREVLDSSTSLWIDEVVVEKLGSSIFPLAYENTASWKTNFISEKLSKEDSSSINNNSNNNDILVDGKQHAILHKFNASNSCFRLEPRQTEAFFNENQIVIPLY